MVPGPAEVGRNGGGPRAGSLARSGHIFQSDSREEAFAEALRIGRSQEYVVVPDRGPVTTFEHRLAEVVYLEEKGPAPTAFEVSLGMIKATESLGFKHEFNPEGRIPEPAF